MALNHGIAIIFFTDLNDLEVNNLISFLINHSICPIFCIVARTVTALTPWKPQFSPPSSEKVEFCSLNQNSLIKSVFSLKIFKFKISAKYATFVKVEPLSKIDDDSNKFPAVIPSSIGWLCQEYSWLFIHWLPCVDWFLLITAVPHSGQYNVFGITLWLFAFYFPLVFAACSSIPQLGCAVTEAIYYNRKNINSVMVWVSDPLREWKMWVWGINYATIWLHNDSMGFSWKI